MSETYGEQKQNTQDYVHPVIIGEDVVRTEATSPDEKAGENPTASERSDKDSEGNEKLVTSPEEKDKQAAKQPRKLRCCDPTETLDIAIGASGVAAIKPLTVSQFLQITCDKLPNGVALCWKDRKGDSWQSLTYAQYKKLIYNVAKSFLKVYICASKLLCIIHYVVIV